MGLVYSYTIHREGSSQCMDYSIFMYKGREGGGGGEGFLYWISVLCLGMAKEISN